MNVSVQPPDFWRLFAQPPSPSDDGAARGPPAPPPLPPPGSSYSQFGGVHHEPPEFVPTLASCGREQLYDERCLQGAGAAADGHTWPTPQSELRRLAAELRAGVARLLRACQAPSEQTRCVTRRARGGVLPHTQRRAPAHPTHDRPRLAAAPPRRGACTRRSTTTASPPAAPPPPGTSRCSAAVAHVELLFVNAQHLAARLREPEALAALVREFEAVAEDGRALVAAGGERAPRSVDSGS